MSVLRGVPVSVRLAGLTTASLLGLLLLLGAVVYVQLGAGLRAGIDQQLADTAADLPTTLAQNGLRERADDDLGGVEPSDRLVQVVDARNVLVASSDDLDTEEPILGAAVLTQVRDGGAVLRTVAEGEQSDDPLRVLAVPYGAGGSVAIVAAELDEVEEAQQALLGVYGPVALLGSVLAGVLGYAVARRGLAPVARMTAEAEAIGGSDLSRRLSAPARLDEVGRLGRTLNGMLSRLEAAVGRERAFTADASHELRTPLAIVRAEVELAREGVADGGVRSALDSALEETQRLSGLVDDLLVLARADADRLEDHRALDLDDLVAVVTARFDTLAQRRGVRLERGGAAVVPGDARGLERAVANLLDNALRHTPAGGVVRVEVQTIDPSGATIAVIDTGPGVPAERLGTLFDRFSRIDGARHEPGGAGLGLAIVAAVASAHGGTVVAENRPGNGLRVVISLPS